MLSKVLSYFTRKSGLARPEKWLKEVFGVEETWSGAEVSPETAMQISAVAACVRLLSESVASLPLFVYRRTAEDKLKAPDHGLYWVLHDRPNRFQTSFKWREQLLNHVLMNGNHYSLIERDSAGAVRALWPVDPATMIPVVVGGDLVYQHWANGKRQVYAFEDVLHVKGPTLDGITGLSIVRMARQGIGLATAQEQHGASLFRNRARPGLLVKPAANLGDESTAKMRKWFDEQFAGAMNSGKTVVLPLAGMDVTPVGFSAEDAQFLQSRQFSVQEIARWFRVPPHLIGDPTRLAYASSETEMNAFLTHTLAPWLANLEAEFNLKLLPDRTQFFVEFDANGMARGDLAARYSAYSQGLAAGFLTVGDVRRRENLPHLPDTDKLLQPANMMPRTEGVNANA